MKKILTYAMVLTLLLIGPGARTAEAKMVVTHTVKFTISSKKEASISVYATATSSVKNIQTISYLQQYKDKKWSTITSWSKVVYSNKTTFSKTHSLSKSGRYRVKVTLRYTGSSGIEEYTIYSAERTC